MSGKDDSASELAHALSMLWRRIRTVGGNDELSLTQLAVVSRLAKEGPATTAELARAEGMKPQSMGTVVGSLEELGLVEREPHATDGRQMHIVLTAKGAAVRKSRRDAKISWLAQAVAQLDKHEQATLLAASKILLELVAK